MATAAPAVALLFDTRPPIALLFPVTTLSAPAAAATVATMALVAVDIAVAVVL